MQVHYNHFADGLGKPLQWLNNYTIVLYSSFSSQLNDFIYIFIYISSLTLSNCVHYFCLNCFIYNFKLNWLNQRFVASFNVWFDWFLKLVSLYGQIFPHSIILFFQSIIFRNTKFSIKYRSISSFIIRNYINFKFDIQIWLLNLTKDLRFEMF